MEMFSLLCLESHWKFPFIVGENHLHSPKERHLSKIWWELVSDSHEILDSIRNAVIQEDRLNKFLVSVAQNPSCPWLQFFIWNQNIDVLTGMYLAGDQMLDLHRGNLLNIAEKEKKKEMKWKAN